MVNESYLSNKYKGSLSQYNNLLGLISIVLAIDTEAGILAEGKGERVSRYNLFSSLLLQQNNQIIRQPQTSIT